MARHRLGLMSFTGLAVVLAGSPALASSKCVMMPMASVDVWQLDYDPLQQEVAMGVFDFKVENVGETPCNIRASVRLIHPTYGLKHEGTSRRVSYSLHNDDTGAVLTPVTGGSRQGGGQPLHLDHHNPSGSVNVRYAVSPGLIPAGVYDQDILLVLEDSHSVLERIMKLKLNVLPSALMGLKGRFTREGSTAVIDLGELTEGTRSLGTKLYVQSTTRYQISVRSANGGNLRQGSTEWLIPYSLVVGDTTMSLRGRQMISSFSTNSRIDDYDLAVHIKSTAGKRAGHYRDTIIFTLAAI